MSGPPMSRSFGCRAVLPIGAAAILLLAAPGPDTAPGAMTPATGAIRQDTVTREFRVRLDPSQNRLDVRVAIDMPEPGRINLLFPGEREGYPGLQARLGTLEAWNAAGSLAVDVSTRRMSSGHRSVSVRRAGRVMVHYTLHLIAPDRSHVYHRVSQLGPSGGHLLGGDVFPRIYLGPPGSDSQAARIRFENLPPDWNIATVAPRAGVGYRVPNVRDAVFILGRLRTYRLDVGPRSLTVALSGDWPLPDARVVDAVERIAGALDGIARDAWPPGDYLYAAARVPAEIPGPGVGGQVIGPSALVYVAGGGPREIELARWRHTTAHELVHWYIPQAFAFDRPPPAWFAEGFTDYLALKALYATGQIGQRDLLDEIGDRLARYRNSPLYGQTSISDAQADFWEEDAYRYIYDGGAAAGLLIDLGLQARGRSLERALVEVRSAGAVTVDRITAALASVPENEWIADWFAEGTDPDWDEQLGRYGLAWRDGRLVGTEGWALDRLSAIRP